MIALQFLMTIEPIMNAMDSRWRFLFDRRKWTPSHSWQSDLSPEEALSDARQTVDAILEGVSSISDYLSDEDDDDRDAAKKQFDELLVSTAVQSARPSQVVTASKIQPDTISS